GYRRCAQHTRGVHAGAPRAAGTLCEGAWRAATHPPQRNTERGCQRGAHGRRGDRSRGEGAKPRRAGAPRLALGRAHRRPGHIAYRDSEGSELNKEELNMFAAAPDGFRVGQGERYRNLHDRDGQTWSKSALIWEGWRWLRCCQFADASRRIRAVIPV